MCRSPRARLLSRPGGFVFSPRPEDRDRHSKYAADDPRAETVEPSAEDDHGELPQPTQREVDQTRQHQDAERHEDAACYQADEEAPRYPTPRRHRRSLPRQNCYDNPDHDGHGGNGVIDVGTFRRIEAAAGNREEHAQCRRNSGAQTSHSLVLRIAACLSHGQNTTVVTPSTPAMIRTSGHAPRPNRNNISPIASG